MAEEAKAAPKKEKKKAIKPYNPGKQCPKCGSRMAEHANRNACGKCGYMEMKSAPKVDNSAKKN